MKDFRLSHDEIQQYKNDGYLIVKNVFTHEEALAIRQWVIEDFKNTPDDKKIIRKNKVVRTQFSDVAKLNFKELLCNPKLKEVVLHPTIIGAAKSILGDRLSYFGDSNYQIGLRMSPFHRDTPGRFDFGEGPDWDGFYDGIRFGIYLEDHKNHSDGLVVKRGSHVAKEGKATFVETELGDIVFWNLRIYHKGNAERLRVLKNLDLPYIHKVPSIFKLPSEMERVAIFFTFFAKDSKHLNNFMQYLKDHPTELEIFKNSKYGKDVQDKLDGLGIKVVKPVPEYGYNTLD